MPLKIEILKHSLIINLLGCLLFLAPLFVNAQEVVTVDSTGVAKSSLTIENSTSVKDSIKPFKRFKAEGVGAVVGDFIIVDFDIDKSYLEFEQQGISTDEISRCQLLGKLMEDKLYVHQAIQDSIMVVDAEIEPEVNQMIQYMISELGSEEKVIKFYRKKNLADLRESLFDVRKDIKLAGRMQQNIVENVEITPEEVRDFFFSIPEDQRPIFSAEVEVAQIVIEPEITEEARQKVIDRLNEFRSDIVENGSSFSTKAVLYSKDGSASKGGLIDGIKRSSPLAKEFKDQAFSLLEGEVSEPFETEFGFHILYVEKIRGQELDVRHIILFPEVSQSTIDQAEAAIENIREQVSENKIDFAEAARTASDEVETRNNGGQLVNPVTGDTRFDLTKMDPTLSAQVYNLKEGEVSKVYTDRDYTGRVKFKILTVTKRYDEHPADYSKDYERIKELALKEKKIRAIETWQNKKIKETYIMVNQDYHNCDFASNWLKN